MVRISKKKALITALIVFLAAVSYGVYALTKDNQTSQENMPQSSTESTEADIPGSDIQELEPPPITELDVCGDISEDVLAVVGVDFAMAGSREAETDSESSLSECNYSKDDDRVNVRIYEYEDEAAAKAEMPELKITGYTVKSKGSRVVSVLVIKGATPDVSQAEAVADAILEKI